MKIQKIFPLLISILLFISCGENRSDDVLKIQLEKIISNSDAEIGLSIIGPGTNAVLEINGDKLYPMLSTVKIPIALAVFGKVEKGELSIHQELLISSEELLGNTWSPFRDKFPNGNVVISLEEALEWMVVHSDNNITDVLIRLAGGEAYIERFIDNKNIIIKNNEADMHKDWKSQFVNQSSPNAYSKMSFRLPATT